MDEFKGEEKTPVVTVDVRKFRKHEGWVGYTWESPKYKGMQNSGKNWKEAEDSLYKSLTFHYGKLGFTIRIVEDAK
jgi:hypothetical protein